MSDTKNTGGPAFPMTATLEDGLGGFQQHAQSGMTIRDYFAATATEGDIEHHQRGRAGDLIVSREQARYKHADAMLKAREQ